MSDIKIRRPLGPSQQPTAGVDPTERISHPSGPSPSDVSAPTLEDCAVTEPAAMIDEIRAGRLALDDAVELMIDQALQMPLVAESSEALRQQLRTALVEMIREDPTLAALASAMKR